MPTESKKKVKVRGGGGEEEPKKRGIRQKPGGERRSFWGEVHRPSPEKQEGEGHGEGGKKGLIVMKKEAEEGDERTHVGPQVRTAGEKGEQKGRCRKERPTS